MKIFNFRRLFRTQKRHDQYVIKRIQRCFKGIDLRNQVFNINGQKVQVDGETEFYKKSEIDKAIKKINKLLRDLNY